MKNIYFILILLFICSSCKLEKKSNLTILHVNIEKEKSVSIFDLFRKIELIPLQTSDKSLIKTINKVIYYNKCYYVLDISRNMLQVFDEQGKYLKQIGSSGQGPNDYYSISDFYISMNDSQIVFLSPIGIVYFYDLDGNFKYKLMLEKEASNYQTLAELTDDLIVFWSFVETDKDQIHIYSKREKRFVGKYFVEKNPVNVLSHSVFHEFNGCVYFSKAANNYVYKIGNNRIELDYEWDFGNKNLEINQFDLPSNPQEKSMKIFELFKESKLPYMITDQNQTSNYYYARLRLNGDESKHVLYNKKNNKFVVFKVFSESLSFSPYFWQDNFVVGIGNVLNKTMVNNSVLDANDGAILSKRTEEDNPCLVKYYFK